MEPLPAPICSSYNKQGTPKTGVKRSKLDRKTGHTSKHCVHTATLLKIYISISTYFKILCARGRQSCHGGGISPGNLTCPEQTNVAACTGSQHSLSCLGSPRPPPDQHIPAPDPQGICKPKERSQRHSKDILNIHPKGATGTLPARRTNPSSSPNKGTTSLGGKWDLRMCCQFPRKGHRQEQLASSFHRFSSRSTQKTPPDTFTFGPTQSDPKNPRNKGLQERTRLSTSQGNETSGSLRGDNSARAALNHSQEGLGSPFSSHQLLQDTPWLTPGSSSVSQNPELGRCHTCPW